jgi:hypothetical protein
MSKTYHLFMPLRATPAWLALSPQQRFAFLGETIVPILVKHDAVRLRFFDCEFYSARTSDMALWETRDLGQWEALVEELRETLFWDHYFTVQDVLLSVENAYASHYGQAPVSG